MGNLTVDEALPGDVMAATHPAIGIDHLTTVPTNFEPDEESADDAEAPDTE